MLRHMRQRYVLASRYVESRVVRASDGVRLHVGVCGEGPDVLVLSGGPGLVDYLERDDLAPAGTRAWFPEPRGVGRSGGGPHDMAQAVADLEVVRRATGVERWLVLGHSWGSDLAVRYALTCPTAVTRVVGIAGHGLHKDRTWSEIYHAGRARDPVLEIDGDPEVRKALDDSFIDWIHEPGLWRALADTTVPMDFVAAEHDTRPSWPLQQLAALVPQGSFRVVLGVTHDFWSTDPATWAAVVTALCRA